MPKKTEAAPEPVMVDHLVIIDGHDYHISASSPEDLAKKITAIRADNVISSNLSHDQ